VRSAIIAQTERDELRGMLATDGEDDVLLVFQYAGRRCADGAATTNFTRR